LMETRNIFVPQNPLDDRSFDILSRKISQESQVSVELIKKLAKKALRKWEMSENLTYSNIFQMQNCAKTNAIREVCKNFEDYMIPMINSKKTEEKIISMASVGLQILFNHQ